MELRCSYLPTQAARYCCSWEGKQPETVFKPKTKANQGLGRRRSRASDVFEKVGNILLVAEGGWIETACYATAESTAPPPLPSQPSLSNVLKLEFWQIKCIICGNQNLGS